MNQLNVFSKLKGSVLLLLFSLAIVSCKKDNKDKVAPEIIRGKKPAVMATTVIYNADGRNTYVGAYPNVPTGDLDSKKMLELGSGYYYTCDSSIFFWDREAVTVTRYEVSDDYQLTKNGTISFLNYGFKYGAELTFVSPTKAIMFVSEQNKIIIWDPSKMEITTSYDANISQKAGMESFPIQIGVSGDYMYYSIFYGNYDNLTCYPKNVVAAVPLNSNGPVVVFEDDRTLPGLGGYIATNGDIYVVGDGDAGNFAAYGSSSYPPTGLLRIKAGQTSFDQSYFIDIEKATGSPGMAASWKIDERYILTRVWDPAIPVPANKDDYFASQNFVSMKLDITDGSVTDFPALARGGFSSNIQDRVDDVTYFPLPNTDASADIAYKLTTANITEAFRTPGAGYWGMRRIR